MKILYLLRYYPTLTESFIYEEIRSLKRYQNADIEIFALSQREDGRHQTRLPDVPVYYVPKSRWRRFSQRQTAGMQWLSQHQRPKDICKIPWLTKQLSRFDHIHVHFAGEAAELARALWLDTKIPYSLHIHAVDLFCPRPSLPTLLRDAQHRIVISQYNQKRLTAIGFDSHVIYCGIDTHFWRAQSEPSDYQAIFVGRNREKKGLSLLLEVWQTLPKPYMLHVLSDAAGREENVIFHGLCTPQRVRTLLEQSRVLILPSRIAKNGDMDGIPVVLLEAMAMNRAIITSNLSGIPELISPQEGWLIPAECSATLRQSILSSFMERRGLTSRKRLLERGLDSQSQSQRMWQIFKK